MHYESLLAVEDCWFVQSLSYVTERN